MKVFDNSMLVGIYNKEADGTIVGMSGRLTVERLGFIEGAEPGFVLRLWVNGGDNVQIVGQLDHLRALVNALESS